MTDELKYSAGLAGVVAGETQIACVDQGKLLYRGYSIAELAEKATFEEVTYLLLFGELPTRNQLDMVHEALVRFRPLPEPVVDALRKIPRETNMMDVLRSMVSYSGHWDPVSGQDSDAMRQRALWLMAQIAAIIAARFRLLNGHEPLAPRDDLSHSANVLYQAQGEVPDELAERLLNLTLVLYAEHDFNASTFTARVIVSTLSDMTSAVVGAIGALKGPLHGGANEAAMAMLKQFNSPEEASTWIRDAFARQEKIMGFGHRVYKNGDHRAHILERELRKLADKLRQQKWMDIYDAIKNPMVKEKKILPNVDYPCGLTYYLLGLPIDLYTPLFVASRVTGWCAHIIEQLENNRLYRPLSIYVGKQEREVVPLDNR